MCRWWTFLFNTVSKISLRCRPSRLGVWVVLGSRKVLSNAWSQNPQISRFLSARNLAVFIRFSAQSWAPAHFYPHFGSGLKNLPFFSFPLRGPPFWASEPLLTVYLCSVVRNVSMSRPDLMLVHDLVRYVPEQVKVLCKPLRYVVGWCWKLALLAYPFFGVEWMSSWVFKIWLYHYVTAAVTLVEKNKHNKIKHT